MPLTRCWWMGVWDWAKAARTLGYYFRSRAGAGHTDGLSVTAALDSKGIQPGLRSIYLRSIGCEATAFVSGGKSRISCATIPSLSSGKLDKRVEC